ncbi:MAG: trypsin-like serine protease [Opitutae bacterium]|nr:trypsin-like serine protease [Opitutae bacterium]
MKNLYLPYYLLVLSKIFNPGVLDGAHELHRRVAWRDDLQSTQYLSLGANNGSYSVSAGYPDFAPVGALYDASGTLGTGTLVASQWVITAAHVLKDNKTAPEPVPANWSFILGVDYDSTSATTYEVEAIYIHPAWEANLPSSPPSDEFYEGDELGVDIALVKLKTPVTGVSPAPLNRSHSETVGELVYFAGFGNSGNGATGATNTESTLRYAGVNTLDRVVANVALTNQPAVYPNLLGGLLGIDFDSPLNSSNALGATEEEVGLLGPGTSSPEPLDMEGTTASGDSGCAAFLKIDGVWTVIGVNSYGITNSTYGDVAVFTRTANFKDWLDTLVPISTQFPVPFSGATEIGSNWYSLGWLGYFYKTNSSWVYHYELGWVYVTGTDASSIWLYNESLGWLWTSSTLYPYLYRSTGSSWLWYSKGNSPTALYDYSQGGWFIFSG